MCRHRENVDENWYVVLGGRPLVASHVSEIFLLKISTFLELAEKVFECRQTMDKIPKQPTNVPYQKYDLNRRRILWWHEAKKRFAFPCAGHAFLGHVWNINTYAAHASLTHDLLSKNM